MKLDWIEIFIIIVMSTTILVLLVMSFNSLLPSKGDTPNKLDRLEQRFESGKIDSISVGDNGTVCVEYLETKCVSR